MGISKEELRRQKAKALRFKKPAAKDLNLFTLQSWLGETWELIGDVQWFDDDTFNLLNALDGDEDEAEEFRFAFSDLAAEVQRFNEDLQEQWVSEFFDIFFPAIGADNFGGYLGYDAYEEDYMGLEPYEYQAAEEEASKKLLRLTKSEILEAAGSCLKVAVQYLSVRYRYDCLEASLKILQDYNHGIIKTLKAIDEKYEDAEKASNGFRRDAQEVKEYDCLLREIPQEYWIQ